MKPLVIYVSGPYSAPTEGGRLDNAHKALDAAYWISKAGHVPLVPHLSHWAALYYDGSYTTPMDYEDYMRWDLALLERCDALFSLGPSPGADRERARAEALGLPVYTDLEDIPSEQ